MTSLYAPSDVEAESAVAWPAVVAGAVAALALSFALLALAAGFGLAFVSPWPTVSGSHGDFTPLVGSAIVVTQVLSCALGGYLAGRLRTKWTSIHDHEVHFRDTVHGLLVWALSTALGVLLAATVLTAPAQQAAGQAAAVAETSVVQPASAPGQVTLAPVAPDPSAVALADREKNIAAQFSLFMGIGLLLSAFVACVAAAIGGLRRDEMHDLFRARATEMRS